MSTTDRRGIDEQQAEIIHVRAHNRLLSDTIEAMQHEIDAHHVIAQTEFKELLELREIVRTIAAGQPMVHSHMTDEYFCWFNCGDEYFKTKEEADHKPDCLWLRAQKYVETWDAET